MTQKFLRFIANVTNVIFLSQKNVTNSLLLHFISVLQTADPFLTIICRIKQANMSRSWSNLPLNYLTIFEKIMVQIGIEDIKNCMLVNKCWKENLDKIKDEAKRQATEIKNNWTLMKKANINEILHAASLAHHGYLDMLQVMLLCNVDLTSIRDDHLASLTRCVSAHVEIKEVTSGSGLVIILEVTFKVSTLTHIDGQGKCT